MCLFYPLFFLSWILFLPSLRIFYIYCLLPKCSVFQLFQRGGQLILLVAWVCYRRTGESPELPLWICMRKRREMVLTIIMCVERKILESTTLKPLQYLVTLVPSFPYPVSLYMDGSCRKGLINNTPCAPYIHLLSHHHLQRFIHLRPGSQLMPLC